MPQGYSGEKMTELENLMTDIQQRQKQALGSIINVTIDDYNNSISAQTAAIRSAIAGDPAQLDTLDQQLRTLMSARRIISKRPPRPRRMRRWRSITRARRSSNRRFPPG